MKFGKDVLLEIVDVVRGGIAEGRDVSGDLRSIDVVLEGQEVQLSPDYLEKRRTRFASKKAH